MPVLNLYLKEPTARQLATIHANHPDLSKAAIIEAAIAELFLLEKLGSV